MQQLISKTTRDGKSLVITFDGHTFVATLDGAELARGVNPGHRIRQGGQMLHVFGGKVGLTLAEGDVLLQAARQAILARPRTLRRADLVAAYQGLVDEQAAQYDRAHARQDARAMQVRESYDARIAAAEQAIREYDAAHPEEEAARQAERQASLERNRWM